MALTEALLRRAPAAVRQSAAGDEAVEAALAKLLAEAHAELAGGDDDAAFLEHVGTLLPAREPVRASLAELHAADLYLAWRCAKGDRAASAAFDRKVLTPATRAVSRIDPSPAFIDEVKQALRVKLLLGEGSAPRLLEYAGRGALAGWVRAAGLRTALNLTRGKKPERADEELPELAAANLDPEFDYISARYRTEFIACLKEALDALAPRERTMLRLHLVNGTGIEALGKYYRVHRTTITRWVAQARTALVADTRRRLTEKLKVTRSELDGLVRVLRSRLDFSISQVLKAEPTPPP